MTQTSKLTPQHRQEWLNSGVDPEIIALNLQSIEEDAVYAALCYGLPSTERRNDGRLRDKWLNRYRKAAKGGWWCSGIDILTGENSEWGTFKADTPYTYTQYQNFQGFSPHEVICFALSETLADSAFAPWRSTDDKPTQKKKTIKYEHPAKVATEAFFLRVPAHIWQKISQRYQIYPYCPLPAKTASDSNNSQLRLQESRKLEKEEKSAKIFNSSDNSLFLACMTNPYAQFWAWVIDANLPITLTEGAKKAGALLTGGFVAISLPGIFNGYRQPKDEFGNKTGFPRLIPPLLPFATPKREINFCFDNDSKIKTKINVRRAIEKTGKLFSLAGCQVNVIQWNDPSKGVDDLMVVKGQDYFEAVYNSRITLAEYKLNNFLDLSPYVSLNINERYIPQGLTIPDNSKLIGVRSLHGTGKTEWLALKIEQFLKKGQKVLIIVHREQLARELARRFGIDYRTEVYNSDTQGIFGYSLCIDSLHPKANPPFNPDSWEDSILIIDEVEQVLWHLLNGATCFQNRTRILKTFRQLLQTVACSELGKIFIADADLSPISINYIEQLIGFKIPKFIVSNSYIPVNYRILSRYSGKCPSQLIKALEKNLESGQKAIIHTDGQTHKSKWGTRNLEAYIQKNFPDLRILRIDRPSVKDKNHPAYQCIDRLNEILGNYDVVICSPVIETGVSIDIDHFDGVYVLSHGVQTVDSVIQAMQRVREDIPRYVWCRGWSTTRIGNGSEDLKTLLSSEHKVAKAHIGALQRLGITEASDLTFTEENQETGCAYPSLLAWGKRASLINYQNRNFADILFKKCEFLGYEIKDSFQSDLESAELYTEMTEIAEKNYKHHRETVATRPSIDDKTFESLKEKQKRGQTSEEEDETLEKATISRLYATEDVNPDLIEKHDEGWYPQLQLHYYLTIGNCYLPKRDRKAVEKLKEQGDGEIFKPDLNRATLGLKIFALEQLGIEQFFDPDAEFSADTLAEWYEKINTPTMRFQIKSVFGFSIGQKDTAIGVAQRFLEKLGLRLCFDRQETIDGKRVRIYRGCELNPDQREEVFSRWLEREAQTEELAA